jgi:hypothetical protein
MPDMDKERKDKASLEYLVWRMTQQKWEDRLHDFDEMRRLVNGVTHIAEGEKPVQ